MLSLFLRLAFLLLATGCAVLPGRRLLEPAEAVRARTAFRELAVAQKECRPWADAEATLTLDSVWKSGTLPGYLQLLAPGFLSFVGLNPLGQPLLILSTDGRDFTSVVPAEMRVYQGPVAASTWQRYVPSALDPETSYYWLTGRLRPGTVKVVSVSGDEKNSDLWVKFAYGDEGGRELVRLDPERKVLRRHLLLDRQEEVVLEVDYDEYTKPPCALPGRITIRSGNGRGTLTLRLHDWQSEVPMSPESFQVQIPPSFNRINIP